MGIIQYEYRPMITDEDRGWFPEAFSDAVESWFTADIACCDACHDEFIALWPHADSANDAEFQRSSIDLNTLYEGSRLRELYAKGDYRELVKELQCPRCGGQLGPNIWPYSLPFDVDPAFEKTIIEIAHLADETPFLLLSHEFAKKVYTTVRTLGSSLTPIAIRTNLYRARRKISILPEVLAEFDRPPRSHVTEGRYNHAGHPVLYLASDLETSFEEMRRTSCIVAELNFDTFLRVLDLVTPAESHPEAADELSAVTYSALMSAKQSDAGWHKPAYVFSRFIADCARSSGIQAIRYPSTRITAHNYNLVVLDPEVRLDNVAKLTRFVHLPAPSAVEARKD